LPFFSYPNRVPDRANAARRRSKPHQQAGPVVATTAQEGSGFGNRILKRLAGSTRVVKPIFSARPTPATTYHMAKELRLRPQRIAVVAREVEAGAIGTAYIGPSLETVLGPIAEQRQIQVRRPRLSVEAEAPHCRVESPIIGSPCPSAGQFHLRCTIAHRHGD